MIKRFLRDETGLELAEYAVATALIALAIVGAFQLWPHYARLESAMVIAQMLVLLPLAVFVIYYDVRYARIPNFLVCFTLAAGISINAAAGGWGGAFNSIKGSAFAFLLMFALYLFSSLGAGDVKLFAAIGALMGTPLIIPMFLTVLLTGGVIALVLILQAQPQYERSRLILTLRASTLARWAEPHRENFPHLNTYINNGLALPYGVAVVVGSLITLIAFNILAVRQF